MGQIIPLLTPRNPEFRQRLLEMKQNAAGEHLIEYRGKPIKRLRHSFSAAVKKAEITYPVCLYDVRHPFAAWLLSRGADLAAVSKLPGHSSRKMTAGQYYHLLHGEKQRAVDLVSTLKKMDDNRVLRMSARPPK